MNNDKFFTWCTVKRHLSKGSLQTTRIRYKVLFRWLGRRKLTADTAEEFVLYIREKGSRNATINSYIRIIKLIDEYERSIDHQSNLLKKIDYFPKQKKTPTVLDKEEIEAILAVRINYVGVPGIRREMLPFIDEMYNLAIWMLASTGCRFDEMASLRVSNLEFGQFGFVTFKDTKTAEDREVPIPPILVIKLKEYIKDKQPNDLLFPSTSGKKQSPQTFNPHLRTRVRLAGVTKHVYAHCFRNSYIMEHIRSGTQHLTISDLVGHRDPKTTLGYTKFDRSDKIRGAENHFLFSRSIPTDTLLDRVSELFSKLPICQDRRFSHTLSRGDGSVVIEFKVRDGL